MEIIIAIIIAIVYVFFIRGDSFGYILTLVESLYDNGFIKGDYSSNGYKIRIRHSIISEISIAKDGTRIMIADSGGWNDNFNSPDWHKDATKEDKKVIMKALKNLKKTYEWECERTN